MGSNVPPLRQPRNFVWERAPGRAPGNHCASRGGQGRAGSPGTAACGSYPNSFCKDQGAAVSLDASTRRRIAEERVSSFADARTGARCVTGARATSGLA